jgi:hypothetical protein
MFNSEHRAERKAARQQKRRERNAAWAAANPDKAARWEAAKAEHRQRKDNKRHLKEFVRANKSIKSYNGIHVYPDRVIRLPDIAGSMFVEAECRPIAGVAAKIEETGSISSRTTLTRSLVPGMHGWQKETDHRKGFIIIDGPNFQWHVEYSPQMDFGGARKFIAAINTTARGAVPGPATEPPDAAPDPMDQLRKLAELCDAGIVTNEEFEAKKAQLLA